jgi:hypothetical protein
MQIDRVETNSGKATSRRTVEDGLAGASLPEADLALGVLDLDQRVVDQDADRQRQSAERHQVERRADAHDSPDRPR